MRRFTVKKRYGEYKTSDCPFCGKIATQQNEQGMNVCRLHTNAKLEEIKCTCGRWLETRSGKFGPYFSCLNCGNINYNKGMAMKEMTTPFTLEEPKKTVVFEHKARTESIKERKETIISSHDVEYFD